MNMLKQYTVDLTHCTHLHIPTLTVIRVFIILIHLLPLLLGITAVIIGKIYAEFSMSQCYYYIWHCAGVFGYNPADSIIPFVNCTLALQFQPGLQYPVQLQLIITGVALIACDVSASLLLCAIKKLSCGVLALAWFLISTVCVSGWSVWSIVYSALVYPIWNMDRRSCDDLIMISMLVSTGLISFFMALYWLIALVVTVYDCWYRCDLQCTCSCKRRQQEFQDF